MSEWEIPIEVSSQHTWKGKLPILVRFSQVSPYIKYDYLNIKMVTEIITDLTKMESHWTAQFTMLLIGGLWEMLHLRFLPLVKKEPRSRAFGNSESWADGILESTRHTLNLYKICYELLLFRCMLGIYFSRWSLEEHHILFSFQFFGHQYLSWYGMI